MSTATLMRANKVTVKVAETGIGFTADFFRTHKHLMSISSMDTGWKPSADATPTGKREAFRTYVMENADSFGIEWKPEDLRSDENVRLAHYSSDDALINDALLMIIPDLKELMAKSRYALKWITAEVDSIVAKIKTSKGTPLDALGITNGKYTKSGNWAWADVNITATFDYNGEEIYFSTYMELVSGQLKKPKLLITEFNNTIQKGLTDAGIKPVEDEPKEDTKLANVENTQEEPVADTTDTKKKGKESK